MNDSLIPIWIITEREGKIVSAHCLGCKAGLAESCSHIATVLFLFRSVDGNKWQIIVYASKMLVTSPHVRGPRGVCKGPRYKLYFG